MRCQSSVYVLLLCAAAIGCQSAANRPAARATSDPRSTGSQESPVAVNPNTDPCAMRLHDLCGPLLLYYATHNRLPAKLDELRDIPGLGKDVQLTCPISNRPYVYNPVGIIISENAPPVIICDPAASHSGYRWGISITEPDGDRPPMTRVIPLPEAPFITKPPG